MAKITQVTIISPTTLRLDVDAKMGDEIDLLDISKIDNMLIQEIINKEKEKEIKKLLDEGKVDAVITLGAVIEGDTQHDEIVVQHAARKITDLSLEYNKPVTLGISGPGMTRLEAHKRVEYGKRAVEAAVKLVKRLN